MRRAKEAGTSAGELCREFLEWWLRMPGAKLPKRPPADVPNLPESHRTEHPPTVAAVITSPRGILISQRVKGDPPWGFLAGKVEPDESPAEAAVREVREEVGLVVYPAPHELSRRVHPLTGKTVIYLVCTPRGSLDVSVRDTKELLAVKWASMEEAEKLLTDLHEPVREYLRHEMGSEA